MSELKIALPDGWEIVGYKPLTRWEHFINSKGEIYQWDGPPTSQEYLVVRKIPQPPKYVPFTAETFEPHRDRWFRVKGKRSLIRIQNYNEDCCNFGVAWSVAFNQWEFEDGTPFGHKVEE